MDIDRLDDVHVEAILIQLLLDLGDLGLFPDLAGHFVVKGPDDTGHTRDLLDVIQADLVVALAVPTETHLHWHMLLLQIFLCLFVYHRPK